MRNRWHLTEREKQILRLIAAGYDHRSIACQLGMSKRTVSNTMYTIMNKLLAINSHHAVAIALRQEILSKEQIPELCVFDS